MKKISFRNEFLSIFLGICLCFLLIESALQLSSRSITDKHTPVYDFEVLDEKTTRILCLGDSFTYGLGADSDSSYPAHLEKILNNANLGQKFNVINLGIPGYNSSQVLLDLERVIGFIKPKIVIIIAGRNDMWNTRYVFNDRALLELKYMSWLLKLKTPKLLSILIVNIKNKFAFKNKQVQKHSKYFLKISELLNPSLTIPIKDKKHLLAKSRLLKLNKEYDQAIELLLKIIISSPENEVTYDELHDTIIKQNKIIKAIKIYTALSENFPSNKIFKKRLSEIYVRLAGYLLKINHYEESNAYYWKAFLINPENATSYSGYHFTKYLNLISQYKKRPGFEGIKNFFYSLDNFGDYSPKLKPNNNNRIIYNRLVTESDKRDEIFSKNLAKIIKICQEYNTILIFSGYPLNTPYEMQKKAVANNVELIEHAPVFKELLKKEPYDKYFVSKNDEHCVSKGYKIMAENMAARIAILLQNK